MVVVDGSPGSPVVVVAVVGEPGWGGRTETFETCCVVGAAAWTGATGVSSTGGAIWIGGVVVGAVSAWAFAAATPAAVTAAAASVAAFGSAVPVVVGCALETTTRGGETWTGVAGV